MNVRNELKIDVSLFLIFLHVLRNYSTNSHVKSDYAIFTSSSTEEKKSEETQQQSEIIYIILLAFVLFAKY